MDSFFGTPWDELTLDAVERFLREDAEAEGLTWEAKGADPRADNDRPHRDSVRKHVSAFANSELGGFYILGAAREERNSGPWKLSPLDFDGEEPTTWLSRVIRTGVNPVPPYDVREWARDGKHVAVLRVDPVAEPPCLTMSGEVFTRVSGESVPVTDPGTLRRLYARGEASVDRALRRARSCAEPETDYIVSAPVPSIGRLGLSAVSEPDLLRVRVSYAPIGVDAVPEGRVLSRSFGEVVVSAARALPPAPLFPYGGFSDFGIDMTRYSVSATELTEGNRQQWQIEVQTDATVTVCHSISAEPGEGRLFAHALVVDGLRPAICAATKLALDAGASGRGSLVISVVGRGFELLDEHGFRADVPEIPGLSMFRPATGPRDYLDGIEAWVEVGSEPTEGLLAAIERELLRMCGVAVWEPERAHDEPAEDSSDR